MHNIYLYINMIFIAYFCQFSFLYTMNNILKLFLLCIKKHAISRPQMCVVCNRLHHYRLQILR